MITISDYVLIYMNPCAHADSLKLFNCKLVKWNYVIEVRFCIKNFQWFRPACHFFSKKFLLPTSLPNRQKWAIQSLETLQQFGDLQQFGNLTTFWTQVHAEIFYSYIPSSISSYSRFCQFLKSSYPEKTSHSRK